MTITPEMIILMAFCAITGGIIGALATRISLHRDLDHLWEAHAQLRADVHAPRHALDKENTK